MIRRITNRSCHQESSLSKNGTNLRSLKQIHASLIVQGFNSRLTSLRELIFGSAIATAGTLNYAHQLFAQITEPDTSMWNIMLRSSAQSHNPSLAVSLYTQMENCGAKPDDFTFLFVLKACTKIGWRDMGFCVHGKVVKYGFEVNNFVGHSIIHFHANCGDLEIGRKIFYGLEERGVVAWSALITGYARRGDLGMARKLFDEMPVKDLFSWNVMITGYAKKGKMRSARKLFDEVPKRDVVTWNAMIAGYVLCGDAKQALKMFEEMRREGQQPNEVTMLSLLSACVDLGHLEAGMKVHSSILDITRGDLNVLLGNALIDMYAKCGSIERALEVFGGMREKNSSTWNSTIGGLAFHGHAEESIKLFNDMQRLKNVKPDEITFVGVLVACSHAGKVQEGYQYFNLMRDVYHIEPNIKHYGCMVDLLGRAGLLNEAFEFIDKMKIEPNAIIWRTLLGACRIHRNVELGRHANERLLKMRVDDSGDYVLLFNTYVSEGEWDGAKKVRKLMDDNQVKKERGHSLIEADDRALMEFLFNTKPMSKSKKPSFRSYM